MPVGVTQSGFFLFGTGGTKRVLDVGRDGFSNSLFCRGVVSIQVGVRVGVITRLRYFFTIFDVFSEGALVANGNINGGDVHAQGGDVDLTFVVCIFPLGFSPIKVFKRPRPFT